MSCPRTKAITDAIYGNRSIALDNTHLNLNPLRKVIFGLHTELIDALYTGGLRERYFLWKKEISRPTLIDKKVLQQKADEGLITLLGRDTPHTILFKKIKEIENKIMSESVTRLTTSEDFMKYIAMDQQIKELFPTITDFNQYMDSRFQLYKTLIEKGYDIKKYHKVSGASEKDLAHNLINDIETNESLSVMKYFDTFEATKLTDYEEPLTKALLDVTDDSMKTGAFEKEIARLASDMIFQTKTENQWLKMMETAHSAVRSPMLFIMYTLGVKSGTVLLALSGILGSIQLYSRGKGIQSVIDSDLAKLLQSESGILQSQARLEANVEFGRGWLDVVGSMITSLAKDNKTLDIATKGVVRVAQGGIHNIWDLAADSWAKKVAIGEAMVEMGIDGYNMDKYLELYKKGLLPPSLIDEIRTRSHDKYTAYFTNSKTASTTTNRFSGSKYLFINFMQGYTMKKTAQIVASTKQLSNAIKRGEIRNIRDFKRFVNGPNGGEFRNILMTSLMAAKVAVYIQTNQFENSKLTMAERTEKVKQYFIALNDFTSSSLGSIPGKLIANAFKYGTSEYISVDDKGNYTTEMGGVDAAVLGFIQKGMDSMYREFRIFSMVPALIQGTRTSGGFDFGWEAMMTEFSKVLNGIGRFSLDPAIDVFGIKPYTEKSDDISDWLMIKTDTNQSMRLADTIRTTEQISEFMNGGFWDAKLPYTLAYAMKNIVPLKIAGMLGEDPESVSKETSLRKFRDIVEKDKVANDIYNGIMNPDVLYTEGDAERVGKPELENVDGIFKSLTTFNSIELGNDGLMRLSSEYGIPPSNFDAIMQRLLDEVGADTYESMILTQNKGDKDTMGAIIQASAEAKVPGSGRMLLSYMANMDYNNTLKELYGVDQDTEIAREERMQLKKAIIEEYGNQLFLTDKSAQFNILGLRGEQILPDVLKRDDSINKVINSVMFTDMLVHQEAKHGNINARYMASVLSLVGKYTPDELRIPMIEKTFYGIDQMDIPEDDKSILKTGIGLSNIDYIGKIAKDPVLGKKYGKSVDNVLNLIYNSQQASAITPNKSAIETGDTDRKTGKPFDRKSGGSGNRSGGSYQNFMKKENAMNRQAWGATPNGEGEGESKSKNTHVQDNAIAREMLSNKLVGIMPMRRSKRIDMSGHNLSSYKNTPKTKLAEFYLTVLESKQQAAQSKKLDIITEKDIISQPSPKKTKGGYSSKKWKTVPIKFKKKKTIKPVTYKG